MTFRFGDFELDEACRELRFRRQPLSLQPRVFNLLAFLIRNRHRVVQKDELLETLWQGTVVGDGSLQRAVSLARAALKPGGMDGAVRNYSRQGYRFCFSDDCTESDNLTASLESHDNARAERSAARADTKALEAAHRALSRRDWDTAAALFVEADRQRALQASDLERLAEAHECAGRMHESLPLLERAAAASSARGDARGVARSALRLASLEFDSGRLSVARGWLNHGVRHLTGIDESWEHGFAECVKARVGIASDDPEAAAAAGRTAVDVGRRLGSEDIVAIGLLYLGYAELTLGRIDEGMSRVDEAAAMVIGGNVSAWAGAVLYCGLIWLCCNRGDWQRAMQWTDGFTRWCERGGLSQFSGLCQLHRAEVLVASGKAEDAEAEIERACTQLARHSPWAEGDAFRILGELRLLCGDLAGAETAFRRAHERGWDPQPGLAMLMAERGDAQSAIRGLTRAIAEKNWALQHRRGVLLARLAIIAARNGDAARAREALIELDARPALWSSDSHAAVVAEARAELAAQEGDASQAISRMQDAVRQWQTAASGLSLAAARFRLAQLLAAEGDRSAALLEVDAARSAFDSAGAAPRVQECALFREMLSA